MVKAAERWTLRAGLFLIPLAYTPTTYDRWVLPKLLVARLLAVLLLGFLVARLMSARTFTLKRSPLDLPWLAFLATGLLASLFASNVNVAIFGVYMRYDGLLTLATYALLFWLTVQSLDGPEDARALLRTLLASAYTVCAVAIVMWLAAAAGGGDASHAYGTLGQWNVLGSFLAVAWPLAIWELSAAKTVAARLLAANAAVVIGLGLVLSFSRSSWAAALLATVAMAIWLGRRTPARMAIAGIALLGCAGLAFGAVAVAGGTSLESSVAARAATLTQPDAWGPRLTIWRESLGMIGASPIVGYGPDNFGLVFPRFNTAYYSELIDKAHAEALQVAATQGLLGLAAYGWLMFALVRACWKGRRMEAAVPVLVGVLAYEAVLQVNFTALGSAFPFWVFAAAAMHSCRAVSMRGPERIGIPALAVLRFAPAVLMAMLALGVVIPYMADASLLSGVRADYAGQSSVARDSAGQAERLAPRESVYAVEVGNVAFERGEWNVARQAYAEAVALGTYNKFVYRNLAISDQHLGLHAEGHTAALAAYEIDPEDPASQALLAEFGTARNQPR